MKKNFLLFIAYGIQFSFVFGLLAVLIPSQQVQAQARFNTGAPHDKLAKRKMTTGISALIPEQFITMNEDDMAQKYPSYKKPISMYTDPNREVDFGINTSSFVWKEKDLDIMRNLYRSTYASMFTDIQFFQNGVIKEIKGQNFIVFEFISKIKYTAQDGVHLVNIKNYHYIQYTPYKDKILVFNFTAPSHQRDKWMPVVSKMMNSIDIAKKTDLPAYQPIRVSTSKQSK